MIKLEPIKVNNLLQCGRLFAVATLRLQLIKVVVILLLSGFSLSCFAQAVDPAGGDGLAIADMMLGQGAEGFKPIKGMPAVTVTTNPDGGQEYTVTLQILFMMTALTFLPAILMMMTSFTRIIIVFSILRQAIGLQQSPSNQILIGLSLFLTLFIMSPVLKEFNDTALQPYINEQITARQALDIGQKPFRKFMLANTRESDLDLFFRVGNVAPVASSEDIPFIMLMPAFITSELKTAFQIGFMIFIPFLVLDIVVASVLMAMGMMMLSPLIISLPFKIMLFVMVDGWGLIIGTLAASFGM
jgi:flagellar biosynthetic protein FliP